MNSYFDFIGDSNRFYSISIVRNSYAITYHNYFDLHITTRDILRTVLEKVYKLDEEDYQKIFNGKDCIVIHIPKDETKKEAFRKIMKIIDFTEKDL